MSRAVDTIYCSLCLHLSERETKWVVMIKEETAPCKYCKNSVFISMEDDLWLYTVNGEEVEYSHTECMQQYEGVSFE